LRPDRGGAADGRPGPRLDPFHGRHRERPEVQAALRRGPGDVRRGEAAPAGQPAPGALHGGIGLDPALPRAVPLRRQQAHRLEADQLLAPPFLAARRPGREDSLVVLQYLTRRLLQAILVVLGVSVISFGVMFLSGDPAVAMAGDNWSRAQIEEFRRLMGFARPWYLQSVAYLGKAVRGDSGTSPRQHRPVFGLLLERLPATLQLPGAALLLSVALSLPIGLL